MSRLKSAGRVLKYGAAAIIVGGSLWGLKNNDWNVLSTGLVRFGRAAIAVSVVASDYKYSLRGIEPTSELYKSTRSAVHTRSALRLRAMCERNGGCFIKVGQHIGVLEYLVPIEYVRVMRVLHTHAPRTPLSDIHAVVRQDLGKPVEELFSSFDPEPLAAASVAQVHRATLKDGTPVVVKVQHPTVKPHSFVDMATMDALVQFILRLFPDFQFCWVAEEARKNLPLELDFISEGRNCEAVGKKFSHLSFFKVPRIYWELTTERVLTMEFCEGSLITDKQYMLDNKLNIKDVMHKLGRLYSEMIFMQGYIHCDPHPGNVLVHKRSDGRTEIVLLDHGLYQSLTDDVRLDYCGLWQSVLATDVPGIKMYAERLGIGRQYPLFACMVTARSWSSVSQGIDRATYTEQEESLIRTNAATYFSQISSILNQVPRQLLLVFKTNDLLRGIEAALGTRADATSFLTMSRCCVRAVSENQTKLCASLWCQLRVGMTEKWLLAKLSIYECYLIVTGLPVYRYLRDKVLLRKRSGIAVDMLESALSTS